MSYTEQITEQEQEIARCERAYKTAFRAEDRAINARMKAEKALEAARERRRHLDKLAEGLKPYLCGKPYNRTHHGDAYQTTTISGIDDELYWWTPDKAAAMRERPWPFAYIIALGDDAETHTALVYLNESANIKARLLRKLVKLPEAA
jgi:hypothetical protein